MLALNSVCTGPGKEVLQKKKGDGHGQDMDAYHVTIVPGGAGAGGKFKEGRPRAAAAQGGRKDRKKKKKRDILVGKKGKEAARPTISCAVPPFPFKTDKEGKTKRRKRGEGTQWTRLILKKKKREGRSN